MDMLHIEIFILHITDKVIMWMSQMDTQMTQSTFHKSY